MGKFVYEDLVRIEIDDRLLAHLQVVIGNKLRRSEAFYFTWQQDASAGSGRTSMWLHANASLVFKFHGSRTPSLSREWLEALMFTANSSSGLVAVPQPEESNGTDGE